MVYEEVYGGIKVLTAIARINVATDSADLLTALNAPDAHIQAVEKERVEEYLAEINIAKLAKETVSVIMTKVKTSTSVKTLKHLSFQCSMFRTKNLESTASNI